ncbi:hypothetical protein [Sanguibacter suaedae]|uniref:Sensor domain-containing protein n=1 Tax=Sanguibacter suaedae TaxID=2795737 RepID=A0A934M7Q2_9MICO|nr:hypothetical protein [Sanguibacter suaedae]MBI9115662.1 hypothetical protein [Sanguibacter suaedae]
MTRSLTLALCTVVALTLSGCGSADDTDTTVDPTGTVTTTVPEPTDTEEPTVTGEPTDDGFMAPTDVPAEAMLPAEALEAPEGPREETEGVAAWLISETCEAGTPESASAMRTVVQGDGMYEAPVGIQQVAAFPDVQAAVDEADRLRSVATQCSELAAEEQTGYFVEDVAVGAQGLGLVTDYYGVGDDTALGAYVAVTRRGNAVTLVGISGGEHNVGKAREIATDDAQEAWNQLCRYDSEGC